jgi:hypothetical protein
VTALKFTFCRITTCHRILWGSPTWEAKFRRQQLCLEFLETDGGVKNLSFQRTLFFRRRGYGSSTFWQAITPPTACSSMMCFKVSVTCVSWFHSNVFPEMSYILCKCTITRFILLHTEHTDTE